MALPTATVERFLGGGRLFFHEDGGTEMEIGAVQSFSFSITPETIKSIDKSTCMNRVADVQARSISGTLSFTTENVAKENLRLLLLGTLSTQSFAVGAELPDGTTAAVATSIPKIEAGKKPIISGKIRFIGANCNGKTPVYVFYKVALMPSGELSLLDSYATPSFTGEILATGAGSNTSYYDMYLIG